MVMVLFMFMVIVMIRLCIMSIPSLVQRSQ